MRKYYVLDTNVLIHDPHALFAFDTNHVVIPITVIDEIDNFKKGLDEKGRNARQVGRYLDDLRSKGSLRKGVKTERGGTIQVVMSTKVLKFVEDVLISDSNDNLIIGTALHIKNQHPRSKVIMVSKDANVRIKSDAVGLIAENFEKNSIKFEELFTGLNTVKLSNEQREKFVEEKCLANEFGYFCQHQFLSVEWEGTKTVDVLRYVKEHNAFYPMHYYKTYEEIFGIRARNLEQRCAFDLLLDPNIKMVSLVGIAGTGKTLLAMASGLHQVIEKNLYSRLVVSRPVSPLGKDLGFLPGTKAEKFNPWMQPIYDNMEILIYGHNDHEENRNGKIFGKKQPSLDDYLDFGFIELEPLTYIRGRSLPNQFLIVDEAQNLTPHEMKTIITRAGEGTKIVLTGDPYQIDIPYLDSQSNGLSMSVEKLKNEDLVGHITLVKGERSELADLAAKYF